MYPSPRNLILFFTAFCALFIHMQSFADDLPFGDFSDEDSPARKTVNAEQMLQKVAKLQAINHDGFVYDIQKVDPQLLAKDVAQLKETFIERQQKLEQLVENKKLDAGDALITIIMPGGLLYAGFRKQEFEQAQNELVAVSTEINELSYDLTDLHNQISSQSLILAQIP